MNVIERRLRAVVNPVSTAITGWWCRSAPRHLLTGHGPSARQRRLIRVRRQAARSATQGAPLPETMRARASAIEMKARAAAVDELLTPHDHQS